MDPPAVVVGLDFGTTYSGFAYAHRSDPSDVHILENWPSSDAVAGKLYCKTQTSLFYERVGGSLELKAWGWPALLKFLQAQGAGYGSANSGGHEDLAQAVSIVGENRAVFATKFKLLLAPDSEEQELPDGLSARRLISDYLKCMSDFIMVHLKDKYGKHFKKQNVQWCVTVPAIWDHGAKQQMKICCEIAGIVQGKYCTDSSASSHDLRIVLEPEAASMYCQRKLHDISLRTGDEFMVVDIGGGTIDLVVHQKANDNLYQVHEAARNCGKMGGGTFVDMNFFCYLANRIGCFQEFVRQDSMLFAKVLDWWLRKKWSFDGSPSSVGLGWDIPSKLSAAWKKYDRSKGIIRPEDEYEVLDLSAQKFKDLFDTEVDKTIQLIKRQLELCPTVKCLLIVGGFSENSYMTSRIREKFGRKVEDIIIPVNPGAAVLHGAVRFGFQSNLVLSRKSKKTYGICTSHKFKGCHSKHVTTDPDGVQRCEKIFKTYVRKNQSVLMDSCVKHSFFPIYHDQKKINLSLFSSDDKYPIHTTDKGCVEESSYDMDIREDLHLGRKREIEVKMYFGRSTIEVTARRLNFGDPKPEKLYFVKFET